MISSKVYGLSHSDNERTIAGPEAPGENLDMGWITKVQHRLDRNIVLVGGAEGGRNS